MTIIDKRSTLPTWNMIKQFEKPRNYALRDLKEITSIAIHHSATLQGTSSAFARYHVEHNGWPGIGYTYVINKNGQIDFCNDWNKKTAHVGNSNRSSLGICLVGDFTQEQPTKDQISAAASLCKMLMVSIPSIVGIKGHCEYPGYEWKKCPAFDIQIIKDEMNKL